MKKIMYALKAVNQLRKLYFIPIFLLLFCTNSFAQLANINYSVKVDRITSYEGGWFGPCWESGTEEYTAWGGFNDNTNSSVSWASCLTCNSNGNCTYGYGAFIGSRTNTNAYNINYYLYAFENDAGSRCYYNSGDDCYYYGSPGYTYIRENAYPSASTYTNGPYAQASSSHRIRLEWTWKYSGTSNLISPACAAQTASYSQNAIRSWSSNLTAGRTYRFSTLGNTSEDTYIRIYGSNGYTLVASNDDYSSLQSLVNFTPSSSGTYYIEVSRYVRNALNNSGGLTYQDVSTPAVSGGTVSSNTSICSGGSASFSSSSNASAGFNGGGFSYQWQVSSNNSSWSNISGANSASYNTSSLTSTRYYRRRATDCKNTSGYSNTVTAFVATPLVVSISSSVANATICANGSTALTASVSGGAIGSQAPFINEIHYDNSGSDAGEAIEVAATAGTNLNGWSLALYNGSNGTVYNTRNLSGVVGDSGNGFGFVTENISGIQNGSPDGIALVDNTGNVIQFLSYEGTLTATNGPANGLSSTNIGVSEASSTAVGFSLQLQGSGSSYGDFTWSAAQVSTFGAPNNNQSFNANSGSQTSPQFSGLSAGTYTFGVSDANGCSTSSTVTIGEPTQLLASSSAPQILCVGGTTVVTVSASGGVSPYTGTGTFTENEGTFTYQVTDNNGCTASTSATTTVVPDVTAPSITCAPDVSVNTDAGVCEAQTTVTGPAASDDCSFASVVNDYNGTSDASDVYPLGTTTITWTVTDGSGNTSSCTQDV
ncbi:MAG: lamin tail domain-containing protein, partial [Flavobacteriales bacterium]|nr:lamin tail domain-containing protein [Flavobacteriales bacterium]